jgi:hypothetical protein
MATQLKIEPLRPAFVRSHPVRMDPVFDDPDAVLDLIAAHAPYETTAKVHNLAATLGTSAMTAPWFKGYVSEDPFLHNPRWIEAAREAFSAEIVRPFACMVNLNAATPLGVPHLDLPRFRGFGAPEAPVWLLLNMSHSGLFADWMVPFASGLMWFNDSPTGGFEYWPDGLDAPPVTEPAPAWNRGVMSDNEAMWHRMEAIGTAEEAERVRGLMRYDNLLHHRPDGGWQMRDGDEVLMDFAPGTMRISVLWKAHVFTDEAHLASFEDERLNLTVEQVVDIYLADLRARGEAAKAPADPYADNEWRDLLQRVYAPPIWHLA